MSEQAKKAAVRAWGEKGRIKQIMEDHSLAKRGKAGLVKPTDPEGTVRVAPMDEAPELRDLIIIHEAGHVAEKDKLHDRKRSRLARPEGRMLGVGPKVQREEMDKLKKDPEYAKRALESLVKEAEEERIGGGAFGDRSPFSPIKKLLREFQQDKDSDLPLSEWMKRRK